MSPIATPQTTFEVLGLHPVKIDVPAHLLEVAVRNCGGPFEIRRVTQGLDGPVPFRECLLDATGNTVTADGISLTLRPELWRGNLRLAFILRSLKVLTPLRTPFGPVELPRETPLPARLRLLFFLAP